VFLDPDGTIPHLFGVIVEHPTGIRYEQQCGGVETLQRSTEGYFIPLSEFTAIGDAEGVLSSQLTAVFHRGRSCLWRGNPDKLPPNTSHLSPDRLETLKSLVESIPYWICDDSDSEQRSHLRLDETRLGELIEAWVPVVTADGPAILVWENCD